ncbi:bifunctional riboflavin kinase/FAD synthetase [Oceanospirillaceae bacterium]|jgi:riboflavin kinase/FMN adenylyltransferase|uniref:bifunctional riboflavin kinase/FAD synthetase n=1 Tax=Candidatus Njordibacter sp. Uisw_002 TaxID=3230971 RepID=UPI00233AF3BC|nr:bifunctional riboflavin kinase/FAD synthetase [Oceanospirillaceae bacterium]|tara:strand:- start:1260 stop:2195 length:936 start_codon:yes stop_codon:yes gene_type:complete
MEFIRGLYNLKPEHRGCVATIGNFDGVHLGHQRVLRQVKLKALMQGLPAVVVLFEPQPLEYFAKDQAPRRITRLREKLLLLEQHGIDRVLCLRFDAKLLSLSPHDFIQQLLVSGLAVSHFVVGDDFRFGKGRMGNYGLLQSEGLIHGFDVENTQTCELDGERVSSTRIRNALEVHDLAAVRRFIGRPFIVTGKVAYGQQLGRKLGVPTANIRLQKPRPALQGVYATLVHGLLDKPIASVANIGYRPTLVGVQPQLEVHLFDFSDDFYGKTISVEICQFIRSEKKFEGLTQLQTQIKLDMQTAKDFFAVASQ